MKLQYQGSSSSLYASRTWRHKSDVLTNSGGRALIKPLWCKDRSEYTQSTQTFKHTGWISATGAGPRVCIRHPDWALMISESWKGEWEFDSASLLCQRLRRKMKKILCDWLWKGGLKLPSTCTKSNTSGSRAAEGAEQGFINGLQRDVRR